MDSKTRCKFAIEEAIPTTGARTRAQKKTTILTLPWR